MTGRADPLCWLVTALCTRACVCVGGSLGVETGVADWLGCFSALSRQGRIFSPHYRTPGGHHAWDTVFLLLTDLYIMRRFKMV